MGSNEGGSEKSILPDQKRHEVIIRHINTLFSRGIVRIANFFGKELYNDSVYANCRMATF
ncbi:hypothetical protein MTCOM_21030 [Moorella thermoacetica]|nr:hypothetical protein MTIN_00060 [Moorella thermoacetica]